MSRDQSIGALIMAGGIIGIVVYGWLLIAYTTLLLQITAFVGVAAILGIIAWIGYTMATTPPPPPLETEAPAPASPSEPKQGSKPA